MRGQSKDHATLRKLCSKFHWLSVPPTVFNVRLTRQRRHNLPRAMQVKARICRQSCHNLNIQKQDQMQNYFGMLLHAPDPTEKSRPFYLKFCGAASRLLRPDVTEHDCKICPDRPKCGGRCGGWTLVSRSASPVTTESQQ